MNITIKKYFPIIILTVFFTSNFLIAQNSDLDAYRKITQIKDASERITELKNFRANFPSSRYINSSILLTFSSFAQLGNVDSSLSYATKFLSLLPEASRESAYNSIASQLAENKIALDVAKLYIYKAVASAKTSKSRSLPFFLNTQAFVYFSLGKADSALIIQKEAMTGNEKNPTYLIKLATYEEASGNRNAALKTIAKSILFERDEKAVATFNEWIGKEGGDAASQEKLKESVAKQTIDDYLKNETTPVSNSTAAAFISLLKVDLPMAKKLAEEAVKNINEKTSVEDVVVIRTNSATVYSSLDNNKAALNELSKAELFATPWDSDFWLLLGSAYEKLNQKEKALDAYLNTKLVSNNEKVDKAVRSVALQLNMGDDAVAKKLETIKEEMKEFESGVYDKKSLGKNIVVAELFTGAECPPCVSADRAFDKLSEFYPRDIAIILEYHLHIPGPDPMTNPDTHLKYVSYGGNFGTPTVFFNGGNQLIGGGPDYITKNRFNVYNYLIQKSSKQNPEIKISGAASIKNDRVNLSLNLESLSTNKDFSKCFAQIALVEKSINYKGSNGIEKHIFVVRDLVNGAEGIPVSLVKGKQIVEQMIDVAQVENSIKTYLDDPSKDASWRIKSGFGGWKARPDNIDRKNLAVVVYIQNKETKEILQAKYFDI